MKFKEYYNTKLISEGSENIDFNKFVKSIKAKYKVGSPYGLITPSFTLFIKPWRVNTALPKEHKDFIEYLNKKQPKNVKEYKKLEIDFLNKRK